MRFSSFCLILFKSSLSPVLNACVAVLFVSTIKTCGVEGNQIPLDTDSLELSLDVSNEIYQIGTKTSNDISTLDFHYLRDLLFISKDLSQINHLLHEVQDEQKDSHEEQSNR